MLLESIQKFLTLLADEIGHNEVRALLLSLAAWCLAGAGLGLLLGFTSYRLFRRWRWYGATSTSGRWFQRGAGLAVVATFTVFLAGAGFWEGVHRGCHAVVTRTRIGTEVLPVLAGLVAEGFAWLDLGMDPDEKFSDAAGEARMAAFRAGTWELDAPKFLGRIDALRSGTFQEMLAGFEREVLKRSPALKGGLTERLLHQTIQALGTMLLEKKLSSELRRHGLDHLHAALRTGLVAEAARHGNPATIDHRELAHFINREGIVPAIVSPVRSFARQQQVIYALIAAFVCFATAAAGRLCRPKSAGTDARQTQEADPFQLS